MDLGRQRDIHKPSHPLPPQIFIGKEGRGREDDFVAGFQEGAADKIEKLHAAVGGDKTDPPHPRTGSPCQCLPKRLSSWLVVFMQGKQVVFDGPERQRLMPQRVLITAKLMDLFGDFALLPGGPAGIGLRTQDMGFECDHGSSKLAITTPTRRKNGRITCSDGRRRSFVRSTLQKKRREAFIIDNRPGKPPDIIINLIEQERPHAHPPDPQASQNLKTGQTRDTHDI